MAAPLRTRRFAAALLAAVLAWTSVPPAALAAVVKASTRGAFAPHFDAAVGRALKGFSLHPASLLSLQKAYLDEPAGPGKAALGSVAWLLTRPEGFDTEPLRQAGCSAERVAELVAAASELRRARLADPALDASASSLGGAVESRVAKAGFIGSVEEALRLFASERREAETLASFGLVLPKALANLQPYAGGLGKDAGKAAVETAPAADKIAVEFQGWPAGLVKGSLHRIINRLAIEGDKRGFTVSLSLSPMPNAMIDPEKADMKILAGLYPFTRSEDELAAVIAHEMTHANKAQLKAHETSALSQKTLDSLSGYKDLEPEQREEIRADLGAVDRLIKAGYNPWAAYDFEKRMTRYMGKSWDMRLIRGFFRLFFRRSFSYLEAHPAGELRMAAVKAYILDRGFKEDLSGLTQGRQKHPVSIRLFRRSVSVYAAPVTSIWVQRSLYLYLLYRLATWAVAALTGYDLAPAVEDAVAQVVPEAGPSSWDAFWHAVGAPFRWFGGLFPDGTGALIGKAVFSLMGLIMTVFPFLLLNMMLLHSNEKFYDQLKSLAARSRLIRSAESGLAAKGKLDAAAMVRLLKVNQRSLESLGELYRDATGLRLLQYTDGLFLSKRRALGSERSLLEGLAAALSTAPAEERARVFAELDTTLAALPGFALETPRVRAALRALLALRPGGPGPAHRPLELIERARALDPGAPAGEVLTLLGELDAAGLKDTAAPLLKARYFRLVRHAFSSGHGDPEAARLLAKVLASLRQHGSLAPTGFLARRAWDARLLAAAALSLFRSRGEAWGVATLAAEVPLSFKWLGLRCWVERAQHLAVRRRLARLTSARELQDLVERELKPHHVLLENLTDDFYRVILAHPEWLRAQEDLDALAAGEHFWPKFGGRANDAGQLEKLLVASLKEMSRRFPELWKYEPGAAEKLHSLYVSRMRALGLEPKDEAGARALWLRLSSRGVTSVTDGLFERLYEKAPSLRGALEREALDQGRVWEQDLKARIVERRLRGSPAYAALLKAPRGARAELLEKVVGEIQLGLPERGLHYLRLLEDLSREIRSSEEESRFLEDAKYPRGGEREEDLSLRVLSDLNERALGWWRSDQWRLVKYLRGDIEATSKIQKAFKTVGPERVRRMYQLLPSLSRAGLLDAFLDSPGGLAGEVTPGSGYSKVIIDHVLPADKPESKEVALEVLEGFLFSLKKTGNAPLQSYVLSYLLSRPKSRDAAAGDTLKEVLELFGATGVKIGQFLAAAQILPAEETRALRSLQDRAKVPDREAIYRDLREISGDAKLPVELEELLGAASIKYAVLAEEKESREKVVLKVFRLDAIAHTRAEFEQIEAMADYLVKKRGPRYGVFRSIVKASRQAVERELKAEHEVAMGRLARETYPEDLAPPHELLLDRRLIASQFAPGSSIYDLPPGLQADAASRIMALEGANLFADAEVIRFDPDRHPGNYRVRLSEGGRVAITPIDFGQFLSITRAQREQVFELFALAQVLKKAGSSRWAAARVQSALGLPPALAPKVAAALVRYFPAAQTSPVAAYYSLLAALDEAGAGVAIVHFDFVRAVIQLGQYEELTSAKSATTPKARLEAEVTTRARKMASEITLTPLEKLRYALKNWRELKKPSN